MLTRTELRAPQFVDAQDGEQSVERYLGAPLGAIRGIDYTVIFARDMRAMSNFYRDVMGFPIYFNFSDDWIEHRVGSNLLALCRPGLVVSDATLPIGHASLQLAFRVRREQVDACARALESAGVTLVAPPTDQAWHHRTLFFRDPDGNLLELYADI